MSTHAKLNHDSIPAQVLNGDTLTLLIVGDHQVAFKAEYEEFEDLLEYKEIVDVELDATTTVPVQLVYATPDYFACLRDELVTLLPLAHAVVFIAGYENPSDLRPVVSSYVYDWIPFLTHYLSSHALKSLFVVRHEESASSPSSSSTASSASSLSMEDENKHVEGRKSGNVEIEALLRKETGLFSDFTVHQFNVASEWQGVRDASSLLPVVESLVALPVFDRSCLQRTGLSSEAETTGPAATALSVVAAAKAAISASRPTASTLPEYVVLYNTILFLTSRFILLARVLFILVFSRSYSGCLDYLPSFVLTPLPYF